MTTYAIGDVRGDFQTLLQLLDKIQFDKERHFLWFTGDLVNGGLRHDRDAECGRGINGGNYGKPTE